MRSIALAGFLAFTFCAHQLNAASPSTSTESLYNLCEILVRNTYPTKSSAGLPCLAHMHGFLDGYSLVNRMDNGFAFRSASEWGCLPVNQSAADLAKMFINYLDLFPTARELPPNAVFFAMISEWFPCQN